MIDSWRPIGEAAAHMIDEPRPKRTDLMLLRARYDSGAVNAAVYAVIKRIECDIAWNEHKRATQIGRAAP